MSDTDYVIAEPFDPYRLIGPLAKPVFGLLFFFAIVFFGFDIFFNTFTPLLFGEFGGSSEFNTGLFEFDPMTFAPFLLFAVGVAIYEMAKRVREVWSAAHLAVRSDGVTVADVCVPWKSIQQVVVIRPEPSAYSDTSLEVGLRLKDNAPLPDDLTSLVIDPETETEIPSALRTPLSKQQLDTDRLVAAVDSLGPLTMSVVEVQGTTEYELG